MPFFVMEMLPRWTGHFGKSNEGFGKLYLCALKCLWREILVALQGKS